MLALSPSPSSNKSGTLSLKEVVDNDRAPANRKQPTPCVVEQGPRTPTAEEAPVPGSRRNKLDSLGQVPDAKGASADRKHEGVATETPTAPEQRR